MRTRTLAALLLLAGCGGGGGGGDAVDLDAAPASDAGCPSCPDGRVLQFADVGGGPPPDAGPPPRIVDEGCPDLYYQGLLPTFELEIDPAEWAALQDEFAHPAEREAAGLPPKPYHPLRAFRFGSDIVENASIRLKGNQHFSWVPPKMQFVISFRQQDPKGRFHGLRKLNLDAPWYDRTLLRERVALSFLREAGLPAPCANNARLVINGEYYGLYLNKEHIDKEFLERNFDDPEGNLYKYGWELKTNEDEADVSRRDALWGASDLSVFESLVDRGQMIRGWAGEAMLPHMDGYWCCQHNFYVYDHPRRGFLFIPHDMDITFDSAPVAPASPNIGPLLTGGTQPAQYSLAMADAGWREDFAEAVESMLPFYDPVEFERRLSTWDEQTANAFFSDPNLPFETAERGPALQRMRDYWAPRRDWLQRFVDRALACKRGQPGEDLDRDGFDSCNDCDDLNREVHPGDVHDACNERDDDCDGRTDEDEVCADCVAAGDFALCARPQGWLDVQATCARQGGVPGVPVDEQERAALAAAAAALGEDVWWVGVSDGGDEGTWVDTAGRVVEMPPFAVGQPNGEREQNCAAFDPASAAWTDEDCIDPHPVVCRVSGQ